MPNRARRAATPEARWIVVGMRAFSSEPRDAEAPLLAFAPRGASRCETGGLGGALWPEATTSAATVEIAPMPDTATDLDALLSGLNDPQREAVTYGEGPLLILAGAGSARRGC